MSDFDYGNARLRVMKSRLLSRQELEALAEAGSLNGLIAALPGPLIANRLKLLWRGPAG